ncbi:MAG TPA: hypothetical protein VHS28_05830 [Chloroflexota bacterium]|nr:hypothetical protein [Chloroflexota bacterium]
MSSFAEREVEALDLSQEEEVTVNTTTVTTTATRSVTREVVAPADSGLRRREVQGREYYGRDAGAGVLASSEEAELERRQARDLIRAIDEKRKGQQQRSYDSGSEDQGYSTARSSYEDEDEDEDEVEDYNGEEEEEEEEEEQHQEERKLASMKKKGEQYVKRVAKEVEDAGRRGASRVKHRASTAAKRASLWRPSSTAGLLFRLALAGTPPPPSLPL